MTQNQWMEQCKTMLTQTIESWEELQGLPETSMRNCPEPGRWCALQCADHLNRYFQWYLPALEKALAKARPSLGQAPYTNGWLGGYFIKRMQPGTQPMKSPGSKAPAVCNHQKTEEVEVLIAYCGQLEQLMIRAIQKNLHRLMPISLSPLLRMQIGDVLGFLVAHLQRHTLQAQTAVK